MDSNEQQTGGNKNLPAFIAIAGLIAIVGLFILKPGTPPKGQTMPEPPTRESPPKTQVETTETGDNKTDTNIKEFTVKANNFKYDITEIKVKKGDTVRINFVNEEGFHDWVVDEFNAATAKLNAGGKETIEFTADETGTFEYYCSVGQHRQMGMVGDLIVE